MSGILPDRIWTTGATPIGPTGKMPVPQIHLIPFLRFRPQLLQRCVQVSAEENVEVLVESRVGMIGVADDFHAREMFAVAFPVAAENDDALARVITRAPQPIALMIADRL